MSTTENEMYGNDTESPSPDGNDGNFMSSGADNPYGESSSESSSPDNPYGEQSSPSGENGSDNPYGASSSESSSSDNPYGEQSSPSGDNGSDNPYGEQSSPSGDNGSDNPYGASEPASVAQESGNSVKEVKVEKSDIVTNEDLKAEILQPVQRSVPKQSGYTDAYSVILVASCALFVVAMQWVAALAKGFFSTDSRKRYSMISGAAFGYLLIKGVPFVLEYLPLASKKIKNLYLGNLEHLLLVVFGVLSLGFVFNYIFEKRAARNTIEEVPHGPLLYGANLGVLGIAHFFFGLHLETLFKAGGAFELIMITLVIGALVFCESVTLANTFSGRSSLFRQIFLSTMIVGGLVLRKLPFFDLTPLMGILSYSFIMGYFIMSALRIEFAIVKRNCHYPTFIISFSAAVAFVVIESLYSSIGNSCPAVCTLS